MLLKFRQISRKFWARLLAPRRTLLVYALSTDQHPHLGIYGNTFPCSYNGLIDQWRPTATEATR